MADTICVAFRAKIYTKFKWSTAMRGSPFTLAMGAHHPRMEQRNFMRIPKLIPWLAFTTILELFGSLQLRTGE